MKESFPKPQETSILESQENQIALIRKLEDVYEHRPDIRKFEGVMNGTRFENEYTSEEITKDESYVESIRKNIDEKNSSLGQENLDRIEIGFQLSEIMQAMIVDRMNKHWFKDCKAIMTSDFDDLKSGIDAVMKHKEGGILGASFDFTVTNKEKNIYNKLKTVWERSVEKGNVPTIKYYEDPDTGDKGRLMVPKFIIGASKKDVEELAEAYLLNNDSLLENHPFKYLLLLQIEEQLQTALDYYETKKDVKEIQFAKKKYEQLQSLLRNMKQEIHLDEKMKDVDLYEYSKQSVSLDTMRRFRITRERE